MHPQNDGTAKPGNIQQKGAENMNEKERKILEIIESILPNLTASQTENLLYFAEGMALRKPKTSEIA